MTTITKCRRRDYHPYIDSYIDGCRSGEIIVEDKILKAMDLVDRTLDNDDVFIDSEKINKAVELIERYFKVKLFDWELFVLACAHCYYKSTDTVVFDEFFIMMGRGNGKNGFISPLGWYFTTHYHGIQGYNVDIIANSEDQAKTSFEDIYNVLEDTKEKSSRFFKWTKEIIYNKKTKSYIKYNTSNARSKDGKRSGCLIFDEVHEYEDYKLINVFRSSFGKKKHSRIFIITTNGYIRDGVLDDLLRLSEDILNGTVTSLRLLPLIYMIPNMEAADDPRNWHMANPSLKYLPLLQQQLEKEYTQMKYNYSIRSDFYTKRMNFPMTDNEMPVAEWKFIIATNKIVPDMDGKSCVAGIDFAKTTDFSSVNLHFWHEERWVDLNHSWLCLNSSDLPRLRIPWQQWADEGLLTLVDDVEISTELMAEYILQQSQYYKIEKIAIDNFRYVMMKRALEAIGFDPKVRKNVYLVRPSDIMRVVPVIESYFINEKFIWGDNPVLRWATNNTKLIPRGKKEGTDTGNFYYGKIEGKSRKTDPFMAVVHSVVIEDVLVDTQNTYIDLPLIRW